MINNMRTYNYYLYKDQDEYGQQTLTESAQGSIKMNIHLTTESTQDNINYTNASYMGLTMAYIDNTFAIAYGDKMLKVLTVNAQGRYKQVFMSEI